MDKLCEKISNEEINVNIKTIDIFYDYKNNSNKIEHREEKAIILTTKLMEEFIKNEEVENYFLDITYNIIPKNKKYYKMMTITGLDNNTNNIYLCALIFLKYEDTQSFIKIFKYLNEMYKFSPKIIHIDYSSSLAKALNEDNIFKNKPINLE